MKYLLLILSVLVLSCQKQESTKVIYSLYHSGNGVLEYKLDNQSEYKQLNNNTFDTMFILPVVSYEYSLKIQIKHYNKANNYSNIKAYIIQDDIIKDSLNRTFSSCYAIERTLTN